MEAGLDRMEEAEQVSLDKLLSHMYEYESDLSWYFSLQVDILQAEQRSNNDSTGSCGGQCSNNKEGEENMNIQGSISVFLSNSRY